MRWEWEILNDEPGDDDRTCMAALACPDEERDVLYHHRRVRVPLPSPRALRRPLVATAESRMIFLAPIVASRYRLRRGRRDRRFVIALALGAYGRVTQLGGDAPPELDTRSRRTSSK